MSVNVLLWDKPIIGNIEKIIYVTIVETKITVRTREKSLEEELCKNKSR